MGDDMDKIVPFKKRIDFKTNVSEITSISLEHNLHCLGDEVVGDLIISGSYKITDSSVNTDSYSFSIPISIIIDEKYDVSNMIIDIDDFYYEIVNNNSLEVNIDVKLDKLKEKLCEDMIVNTVGNVMNDNIINDDREEECVEVVEDSSNVIDSVASGTDRCIDDSDNINKSGGSNNLLDDNFGDFDLFDDKDGTGEVYRTYSVYIVRENDTMESIMAKYNIGYEELGSYNDLTELKLGDKLIIPFSFNV